MGGGEARAIIATGDGGQGLRRLLEHQKALQGM
nr:MAG TPA: hypothetical protein [Caudoviricetes sp.]